MAMKNINIIAPINQLGYGVVSLNIVKSLSSLGVNVSLFPIGGQIQCPSSDVAVINKCVRNATLYDPSAPCVKIWHQNDLALHAGKGLYIGFPIFELDTFTDIELHHLSSCDELFVCSKWAKSIIKNSIRREIEVNVIQMGVDMSIFPPTVPHKSDKIVFLNCGKWEKRKGHDILIEAFKRAYRENNNIELWMMCTNPFNTPEEEMRWRNLYKHEAVKIIPRAETQQEVYNIMAQSHCGVFPSRAEGWNLELLEMMSVGRHVITTNYSAHTEFCNDENASLIEIEELEPAVDNKWFFGQGKWAKINENTINQISKHMLSFADSYKFDISEPSVETAAEFSWTNTAKQIISALCY